MFLITDSLRQALEANGLAVVPIKLTDEMRERMAHIADGPSRTYDEYWAEMLDAALVQKIDNG